MPKPQPSVSGTSTLPEYQRRRSAPDFRGELERTIIETWASMNVRDPMINYGRVPVDDLVPRVRSTEGVEFLDPNALAAINTAMQWLFGTNEGLECARKMLSLEAQVADRREKRIKKIPSDQRTIADMM